MTADLPDGKLEESPGFTGHDGRERRPAARLGKVQQKADRHHPLQPVRVVVRVKR